ncbi:hypothetical protein QBC46DRAFT_431365 [Diplogelasinospora grovesii]|uniref:F-box domain-containing protein n=1 Tax=Diplogelasinospora grovesii TaxID=303347 RepID=A0AAN6MWF3_9PEZI|nr:hypothetical protein QBC46DRAFT_431365 [Diplogelasinospora grovesii]
MVRIARTFDRITRLFRRSRKRPQWPNAEASIGTYRGKIPGKDGQEYMYWEVTGPAAEIWRKDRGLGQQIRTYIADHYESTNANYEWDLTVHLYMFGVERSTAAPKVIFRSNDLDTRRRALAALEGSGIMDDHPSIDLGHMPLHIHRLATSDVPDSTPLRIPTPQGEKTVFSTSADNSRAFGRRFFIQNEDGSLRPATGGVICHIGDRIYQMTADHAFSRAELSPAPQSSTSLDEVFFESMGDIEDDENELSLPANQQQPNSSQGPAPGAEGVEAAIGEEVEASTHVPMQSFEPSLTAQDTAMFSLRRKPSNYAIHKATLPSIVKIGKRELNDFPGTSELDSALVELEEPYSLAVNKLPASENVTQTWLFVTAVWDIAPHDVRVATVTSSSGYLCGTLSPAASFVRFPGSRGFQEVYPVTLEGQLAQGDCGAAVVDRLNGHLYGHIVAGVAGTGLAYIVSAKQVVDHIEATSGLKVRLTRDAEEAKSPRESSEGRARKQKGSPDQYSPWQFVQFASKKYFDELDHSPQFASAEYFRRLAELSRNKGSAGPSHGPLHRDAASLPLTSSGSTDTGSCAVEPHQATDERPGQRILQYMMLRRRQKTETRGPSKDSRSSLQELFFLLPVELQAQILGNLTPPEIVGLRLVSRQWNNLITSHEFLISRSCLEEGHIPSYAIRLFPATSEMPVNLRYISALWHRFSVALRLSDAMTEWITRDMFLRRTPRQRQSFRHSEMLLRRRLLPLLLTIFHFLESYREQLVVGRAVDHVEFERRVIARYDNRTLLKVHQFFPVMVTFLCRRLRPPSYLGKFERPLRGYIADPPTEQVQVAILCLGGLREVLRLTAMGDYERLCAAADEWYQGVSGDRIPIRLGTELRRALLRKQLHISRLSTGPEVNCDADATLTGEPQGKHGNDGVVMRQGPVTTSGKAEGASSLSSLGGATGPPMPPLPRDVSRAVLQKLPATKSQIWLSTAQSLLLERGVVERVQDIPRHAQVLHDLVSPVVSWLDMLFFERGIGGGFDFDARIVGSRVKHLPRGVRGDMPELV